MVMGQFVTTYRKEFLWPYVSTLGLKPDPKTIYEPDYRTMHDCMCRSAPNVYQDPKKVVLTGPEALKGEQWSRLGPMGPLLEPKIFGARVGTAPESAVHRFNQPSVFMKKIQEKYPFIYECLKAAPPDDLLARINRERLATTYMVDFCNKREYPAAPYDELIKAAGIEGIPPCPEPIKLPGDICRPSMKVKAKRDCSFTTELSLGKEKKHKLKEAPLGSCRGGVFSVTPGNTEYMDTVSRLGTLIIRDGIHDPARRKVTNKYK